MFTSPGSNGIIVRQPYISPHFCLDQKLSLILVHFWRKLFERMVEGRVNTKSPLIPKLLGSENRREVNKAKGGLGVGNK
jgi:hypothetical protein